MIAVARIEGDDAARAFLGGEVVVLGVGAKRIGLVGAFGEENGFAGADEEKGIAEVEGGGDPGAAVGEESGHIKVAERWRAG